MKGSGRRLFTSAIFNVTYRLLTTQEINDLHDKLCTLFAELPHGPFKAVDSLIGRTQTLLFCDTSHRELVLPPSYHNQTPIASPSRKSTSPRKRRRIESDDEIEPEYIIVVDSSDEE